MKKFFWIFLSAVICICCVMIFFRPSDSRRTVISEKNEMILLDAGHGGEDGGAVSEDGMLEKDINLDIAKRCEAMLVLLGRDVLMTRNDDSALDDGSGKTIAARKAEDIRRRTAIANASELLVSVHMNSFPDARYWGTQCFYAPTEGSKELGELIQDMCSSVCIGNTRSAKKIDGSVYLLNHVTVPAVIVECGFLSNTEEAKKLADADYQKRMAAAISAGIVKFMNKTE